MTGVERVQRHVLLLRCFVIGAWIALLLVDYRLEKMREAELATIEHEGPEAAIADVETETE